MNAFIFLLAIWLPSLDPKTKSHLIHLLILIPLLWDEKQTVCGKKKMQTMKNVNNGQEAAMVFLNSPRNAVATVTRTKASKVMRSPKGYIAQGLKLLLGDSDPGRGHGSRMDVR